MTDELAARRAKRAELPDDGDLDVVEEDLRSARAMVTEARAEAAQCTEPGIRRVRDALSHIDESIGATLTTIEEVKET